MKDIIESICTQNNWVFNYGRSDFHNLFDGDEQEGVIHIFLDPVVVDDVIGDYNDKQGERFTGSFMIVVSSYFDETSYNFRYENYIKQLSYPASETIKNSITCNFSGKIEVWKKIEVINALDYNFDGLIVTYSVLIDE